MGRKFKELAIEHCPAHLITVHTGFLVVALDLSRNPIHVDKGRDQLTQQGLTGLVIHHRDVLPARVTKDVTKEGDLFLLA